MTPRYILVHCVCNLTTYLVIFWVMSICHVSDDHTIVIPDDKQWIVSHRSLKLAAK